MAALHITTGGPSGLPLSLIGQAIPKLSRHDLEALTERLIEHLDELDGDPDLETAWAERHSVYALNLPLTYDPRGSEDDEDNGDRVQVFHG